MWVSTVFAGGLCWRFLLLPMAERWGHGAGGDDGGEFRGAYYVRVFAGAGDVIDALAALNDGRMADMGYPGGVFYFPSISQTRTDPDGPIDNLANEVSDILRSPQTKGLHCSPWKKSAPAFAAAHTPSLPPPPPPQNNIQISCIESLPNA